MSFLRSCVISLFLILALTFQFTTPLAATPIEVKNCVNLKTGKARLVSPQISKCKKGEKLFYLEIPEFEEKQVSIFRSGFSTAIDYTVGNDGDFYLDRSTNQLYGPRTNGLWGFPINLSGAPGPRAPGLLSGRGEPTFFDGLLGDFYLDLNSYKLFGPKSYENIWGVGIPVIGPQGVQGATGATGVQGAKGDPGGFGYHGSFYDTSTVTLTQNQMKAVPFHATDFSNGITIENDGNSSPTKVRFQFAGKYNIAFSMQLTKTDSGTDITTIWLCLGSGAGVCTNIPWTSTEVYLFGNDARQVAAWNFFVNIASNDYIQLLISSGSSTGTQILSSPAQTSPSRPKIPSTILTVNQIG